VTLVSTARTAALTHIGPWVGSGAPHILRVSGAQQHASRQTSSLVHGCACRDKYYWWSAVDQTRLLLLVCIVVFGRYPRCQSCSAISTKFANGTSTFFLQCRHPQSRASSLAMSLSRQSCRPTASPKPAVDCFADIQTGPDVLPFAQLHVSVFTACRIHSDT
jgi:hypothetical protein